jgi:hypothetical protein
VVKAFGDIHSPPPIALAVVTTSPLAFFAALWANAVPLSGPLAPPLAEAFAWTLRVTATPVA